jgi:putative addiction module killer protein
MSALTLELRQTGKFAEWFRDLRDRRACERIAQRLARVQSGLLGDVKPVGGGVNELRIDYGPGYRVYFTRRGATVVLLLCGGDKSSQARDIEAARAMAKEIAE